MNRNKDKISFYSLVKKAFLAFIVEVRKANEPTLL
jgi:hypothetical protein